ncbi:MAG: phosphate propanoyltransferase [Candidatus Poribacteria bacterium]
MNDRELIDLITRKVLERVQTLPCEGCAMQTCDVERACHITAQQNKIPVGVSARHVHLTREHLEQLYGPGRELTVRADLYQPGNFAAEETVTIVGPRMRAIEGVRILGPLRNYSQVEIARTDAITLGLDPPIRDSGDLEGAAPILLVGPAGSVFLEEGAICAVRHLHLTPEDAECLGVKAGDELKVRIPGIRALTFENVRPKISEGVLPQLHLDTDDANAAGLRGGEAIEIIKE